MEKNVYKIGQKKSRKILLSQVNYDNYTLYMYVCAEKEIRNDKASSKWREREAKKRVDEANDEKELSKV